MAFEFWRGIGIFHVRLESAMADLQVLLQQMMMPDNATRQHAEAAWEAAVKSNPSGVVSSLMNLLTASQQDEVTDVVLSTFFLLQLPFPPYRFA